MGKTSYITNSFGIKCSNEFQVDVVDRFLSKHGRIADRLDVLISMGFPCYLYFYTVKEVDNKYYYYSTHNPNDIDVIIPFTKFAADPYGFVGEMVFTNIYFFKEEFRLYLKANPRSVCNTFPNLTGYDY